MSATVTTVGNTSCINDDHTSTFRAKTSRISRSIQNPAQRIGFDFGSDVAVQDLANSLSKNESTTSRLLTNVENGHSTHSHRDKTPHEPHKQASTEGARTTREHITRNLFGAIIITTITRSLRSRFVDEDYSDEECQYEHESNLRILPAQWLLKLGLNYAYNISTYDSSTRPWQFSITPINLVPDDALIFEFCKEGNLELVRDLFSRNLASVRDVDSGGYTALHVSHGSLHLYDEVKRQIHAI